MEKLLLPCPFCGSRNLTIGDNYSFGDMYVKCQDCYGMMHEGESIDDTIHKWNERTPKNDITLLVSLTWEDWHKSI